jgi:hypothetical protein
MNQKNLKLIEAEKKCDKYNVRFEVRKFIVANYIHCSIYTEQHEKKQCSRCSKVFKICDPICLMKHQKNKKFLCQKCYDKMFVSVPDSDEEEDDLNAWY